MNLLGWKLYKSRIQFRVGADVWMWNVILILSLCYMSYDEITLQYK